MLLDQTLLQALQSVALDLVRIVAYRLQAGIGVALLVGVEVAVEVGGIGRPAAAPGVAEADPSGSCTSSCAMPA
ncbi:hypothetical protein P4123_08800 [Pseudomonas aeruginosa]|nr:hypothetical protein [Pseudomonas aeruginosa]